MKNKIRYLLIFFITCILQIKAQTYVSGGIYSNTIWRVANSPYIINGNLTLFPNDTLTIEPGVVIKADSIIFEVRGAIISIGNINDSITFTSTSLNPKNNSWRGLLINTDMEGSGKFQYTNIKYSLKAIDVKSTGGGIGGPLNISHCNFDNNTISLSGGPSFQMMVDRCSFTNNIYCIVQNNKTITYCNFENNYWGIYEMSNAPVYNSSFCGNNVAVSGTMGTVQNSVIMHNGIGIICRDGLTNINNNVISQNDTGIVLAVSPGNPSIFGSGNIICGNYSYNLVNNCQTNISVPNVCWCDADPAMISQKIYDGYDNINYGLIDFSPFIVCNQSASPTACQDLTIGISTLSAKHIPAYLYPNPMKDLTLLKLDQELQNAIITITNVLGQTVFQLKEQRGTEFTFQKKDIPEGLYFLNIFEKGKNICTLKLIVSQ